VGDPDNGGRFTVKKYHSQKTLTADTWHHDQIQLLLLNPDYLRFLFPSLSFLASQRFKISAFTPKMVVVGEWVSSID
jgi:hypothetical protein